MTRLLKKYNEQVIPNLKKELDQKNVHALPKVQKVIINMGVGQAVADRKVLDEAVEHLSLLSGQKPQITRAKKAIAVYRLREGMPIGCRVTLRGARMYEFLDRLITLALPRVRDFRGLPPKSFDGNGNYSLGLNEQFVFPEIPADKATLTQGMNITIVTSAKTNDEGRALLREIGIPFKAK
ncbi:MAG: 50S ribosomal protein L5 [Planctomycetaceae bacterium]|mgnify:CR=1 FL=1|jgi:large subunit ribosomal protein L5|nr:50S ribosomal protein L5 [Planctomycetaceae bacterium]MDC0274228.1 50S ribosomal protein L5 [Planctomycetaceae bacterium]MDG2390609.1 50S ribosomal protein L5 [Planctomycetaceae bacterium]